MLTGAAGGAGDALHLICLNEYWDPALLTLRIQGLGMAAALGSCLRACQRARVQR